MPNSMLGSAKWVQAALEEYDDRVQGLQGGSFHPELVAASILQTRWRTNEGQPGHVSGVRAGALFKHYGELVLLGLHNPLHELFLPGTTEKKEGLARLNRDMLWAPRRELVSIALDSGPPPAALEPGFEPVLPTEGRCCLFDQNERCLPHKAWSDDGATLWIYGQAGFYEGWPSGDHLGKGTAQLLEDAALSRPPRHVRVLRPVYVAAKEPEGSSSKREGSSTLTYEKWWLYVGLFTVASPKKWDEENLIRRFKLLGVPNEHLTAEQVSVRVQQLQGDRLALRGAAMLAPPPPAAAAAAAAAARTASKPHATAQPRAPQPSPAARPAGTKPVESAPIPAQPAAAAGVAKRTSPKGSTHASSSKGPADATAGPSHAKPAPSMAPPQPPPARGPSPPLAQGRADGVARQRMGPGPSAARALDDIMLAGHPLLSPDLPPAPPAPPPSAAAAAGAMGPAPARQASSSPKGSSAAAQAGQGTPQATLAQTASTRPAVQARTAAAPSTGAGAAGRPPTTPVEPSDSSPARPASRLTKALHDARQQPSPQQQGKDKAAAGPSQLQAGSSTQGQPPLPQQPTDFTFPSASQPSPPPAPQRSPIAPPPPQRAPLAECDSQLQQQLKRPATAPPEADTPNVTHTPKKAKLIKAKASQATAAAAVSPAPPVPPAPPAANVAASEAGVQELSEEQIKVQEWRRKLITGPEHLAMRDLSAGKSKLPVPVFWEGPEGPNKELEVSRLRDITYLHKDYQWADGVLAQVWPVLLQEEAVTREVTDQPAPMPDTLTDAGAMRQAAQGWWTRGSTRPFCATTTHARLFWLDPHHRKKHPSSLTKRDEARMRPFNEQGMMRNMSPRMPVIHQCSVGCTCCGEACRSNSQLLEGPAVPLEVFRVKPSKISTSGAAHTADKHSRAIGDGVWGVRCPMQLNKGRFVCLILGELNTPARLRADLKRQAAEPGPVLHLGHVIALWQWVSSQGLKGLKALDRDKDIRQHELPAPPATCPTELIGCLPAAAELTAMCPAAAQIANKPKLEHIWQQAGALQPSGTGQSTSEPPTLLVVDMRRACNVARFMRHCNHPNLHVQLVYAGSARSSCCYYLALYAADTIHKNQELTYDHEALAWIMNAAKQ